jgi:hypothetical protein
MLIFKCVARLNFCETPAIAKPPPRYLQASESAVGKDETETGNDNETGKTTKNAAFAKKPLSLQPIKKTIWVI